MDDISPRPIKRQRHDSSGSGATTESDSKHRMRSVALEAILKIHTELCLELNMDSETQESSWRSYESISEEHSLEVNIYFEFKVKYF